MLDLYQEGDLEKGEFEPRYSRARQRLSELDSEASAISERITREEGLGTILESFERYASRVRDGLESASWGTRPRSSGRWSNGSRSMRETSISCTGSASRRLRASRRGLICKILCHVVHQAGTNPPLGLEDRPETSDLARVGQEISILGSFFPGWSRLRFSLVFDKHQSEFLG